MGNDRIMNGTTFSIKHTGITGIRVRFISGDWRVSEVKVEHKFSGDDSYNQLQ